MKYHFLAAVAALNIYGVSQGENLETDSTHENIESTEAVTDAETSSSNDVLAPYFETRSIDNQNDDGRPLTAQSTTDQPPAEGEATTPPETTTEPTPTTEPATKTTPPKKTKKKKKKSGVIGADGSVTSAGVAGHGAQDSGAPYRANIELGFDFSSKSQNLKYTNETFKTTSTHIGFDIAWLFVFLKMEAGPLFYFSSDNQKTGSTTIKSSAFGLGGAFFFNMGNIHSDKFVPYAGVKLLTSSETIDSGSKVTDKMTDFGIEGGMKFFLGAHLALKPFLKYQLTFSGESKSEATSPATVASITGSELNLGLGLAKYF
jgi:hypothetical protein